MSKVVLKARRTRYSWAHLENPSATHFYLLIHLKSNNVLGFRAGIRSYPVTTTIIHFDERRVLHPHSAYADSPGAFLS